MKCQALAVQTVWFFQVCRKTGCLHTFVYGVSGHSGIRFWAVGREKQWVCQQLEGKEYRCLWHPEGLWSHSDKAADGGRCSVSLTSCQSNGAAVTKDLGWELRQECISSPFRRLGTPRSGFRQGLAPGESPPSGGPACSALPGQRRRKTSPSRKPTALFA